MLKTKRSQHINLSLEAFLALDKILRLLLSIKESLLLNTPFNHLMDPLTYKHYLKLKIERYLIRLIRLGKLELS